MSLLDQSCVLRLRRILPQLSKYDGAWWRKSAIWLLSSKESNKKDNWLDMRRINLLYIEFWVSIAEDSPPTITVRWSGMPLERHFVTFFQRKLRKKILWGAHERITTKTTALPLLIEWFDKRTTRIIVVAQGHLIPLHFMRRHCVVLVDVKGTLVCSLEADQRKFCLKTVA